MQQKLKKSKPKSSNAVNVCIVGMVQNEIVSISHTVAKKMYQIPNII